LTLACNLKGQQKLFFLHLNQATSCCKAYPVDLEKQPIDHYIQLWRQESQQLLAGVELPGCKFCWKAEHAGLQSYRQQAKPQPEQVEIFINNACNQMCSYCSPKFSSTWEDSIATHGNFKKISDTAIQNLSIPKFNSNNEHWIEQLTEYLGRGPVVLKLLGGEPLMQKRNLEQLLKLNSHNILQLAIVTNLNPPDNKFLKWVLDFFPSNKLKFNISLDAIPSYNAVPRAGFDSIKFEQNLQLLKQHNVSFEFQSVVSVLSVFGISAFQDWLLQNKYQTAFSCINNPDCLDPAYLPDWVKQKILTKTLPMVVQQQLQLQPKMLDLKLFEQYNYLSQYIDRTHTQLSNPLLQQYWDWLKEKYEKY